MLAVTIAAMALAFAPSLKTSGSEWVFGGRPEWVTKMMIYWIGAFLGSSVPAIVLYAIAKWFRISHVLYYLLCGAVIGSMLSPVAFDLCAFPADRMCVRGEPEDDFWDKWWTLVMPFVAGSGALGGLAFWWVTGRHMQRVVVFD
jgi:ABC-type Fe3+-siderophore transport system permease subunit